MGLLLPRQEFQDFALNPTSILNVPLKNGGIASIVRVERAALTRAAHLLPAQEL
jgi:hypothetical protein